MASRGQRRGWDLLFGGLLAGVFLAFFWRTVSGMVYRPADGGDLVSFLFPIYRFAAQSLSQGRLPLWNPHLYGGAPFIGDIQAGFLYPPNLLLFLLNPSFDYRWMQLLSIGHFWWAGLGVFVLVRTVGQSRPAALLAGIAFGLCDILFIHLGNLNLIAVLSWSGWILAACHRMMTRRSLSWAGVAASLIAVANYAGHAQSSYYLALAVSIFSLALAATRFLQPSSAPPSVRRRQLLTALAYPAVAGCLAILLTAPIFLPALEMLPFTNRGSFGLQDTVSYSLAPGPAIMGLFSPSFFGRGPWDYWGSWDRVELPYAGLVTLLLAAGALLLPPAERRTRLLPWCALAVFGFVAALGGNTPIHRWMTQFLPLYGNFQAPARAIVLWALALSALAAIGLDTLLAQRERFGNQTFSISSLYYRIVRFGPPALALVIAPLAFAAARVLHGDPAAMQRATIAGAAALIATAVWTFFWALTALYRRERLAGAALAALLPVLLLFELYAVSAAVDVSRSKPTGKFHHPGVFAFLREQAAPTPLADADPTAGFSHPLFRIDARTGIYDLWQPNTPALAGLQDVWGIYNPLILTHWRDLWENNGGRHTRIFDLYNVRYVIVRDGTPLPEQYFLAYDDLGPLAVYENPDPLPRAWLVAGAEIHASSQDALDAMLQPEFAPSRTVVLIESDAHPTAVDAPPASMEGPVSILSYNENEILLAADAASPGYLVLSEVWYPGWKASVNGVETPLLRANHALRAAPVPQGKLKVRLWYEPRSWRRGLALFATGVVALAGLWLWPFYGKRVRSSGDGPE